MDSEITSSATIEGRFTIYSHYESSLRFVIATSEEKAEYVISYREVRRIGKILLMIEPSPPTKILRWFGNVPMRVGMHMRVAINQIAWAIKRRRS